MVEELEYYAEMATEVVQKNRDKVELYLEIDRMMDCDYENPRELEELSWISGRKFVTTAPADAANAATRAFAARAPILSVSPLSEEPEEYERVERMETALEWEFKRMNMIGKKPIHWQIVGDAMRYCKIALQVEYLPYALKKAKKDNRVKSILRNANFNWHRHHPGTVFTLESQYGVEAVVKRGMYSPQQLIYKFGKENPGVQQLMADIEKGDHAARLDNNFVFTDITDWNARVQFAAVSGNPDQSSSANYEFRREAHKIPFIPWVVVDHEDAILKSVVDAELWDNANAIRTIVFSKAVTMASNAKFWVLTTTGDLQGVEQDNTNPNQPMVGTLGQAQFGNLPPNQVDQQMANIQNMADSDIFRSSVAQVLASAETIGATSTFSTVNAMLQAALTQLVLAQTAAERAEQLAFKQMLEWVDYSKIPLVAYRPNSKTVGETVYNAGQEITLTGQDYDGDDPNVTVFDIESLYLDVKLQPKSITDKQAEITNGINIVDRLGGSKEMVFDDLGLGDFKIHQERRAIEDLFSAEIQAEQTRILQKPELEAQQMIQAQQQAQAQQISAQNMAKRSRGNGQNAGSQGFDVRAGGNPPAANTPGMGREQVTGESATGEGLA